MKKLFAILFILFSLTAFGQNKVTATNTSTGKKLTITSVNTITGYTVTADTDFKKFLDSNAAAAKAAAAKTFADSMKPFSTVETVRETLRPDSVTGKTFQLSFKPLNAIIDRVIGISDGGNMELVENVDYTITKTTGKITLIGKGIPLFARKNLFAVYQKISP